MEKERAILLLTSFCTAFIVLASLASADKMNIEIAESFPAGGNIDFRVMLYDDQNSLINDNLQVIFEDAEKIASIEKTIESNKPASINLGENPRAGLWSITAKYKDLEMKQLFTIETNEIANFEIQGDKLFVKNIGNSPYIKTVQVAIGDTIREEKIDLDVGEETSFRLVAPDGAYSIRVTDGKTTITKSDVQLTGNVVGVLDEKLVEGANPVTGGLKPEPSSDESFYSSIKNKKIAYVFLLIVIGAAILMAIERNYRKKNN